MEIVALLVFAYAGACAILAALAQRPLGRFQWEVYLFTLAFGWSLAGFVVACIWAWSLEFGTTRRT